METCNDYTNVVIKKEEATASSFDLYFEMKW